MANGQMLNPGFRMVYHTQNGHWQTSGHVGSSLIANVEIVLGNAYILITKRFHFGNECRTSTMNAVVIGKDKNEGILPTQPPKITKNQNHTHTAQTHRQSIGHPCITHHSTVRCGVMPLPMRNPYARPPPRQQEAAEAQPQQQRQRVGRGRARGETHRRRTNAQIERDNRREERERQQERERQRAHVDAQWREDRAPANFFAPRRRRQAQVTPNNGEVIAAVAALGDPPPQQPQPQQAQQREREPTEDDPLPGVVLDQTPEIFRKAVGLHGAQCEKKKPRSPSPNGTCVVREDTLIWASNKHP